MIKEGLLTFSVGTMTDTNLKNILIPQVTKLPGQNKIDKKIDSDTHNSEFKKLLETKLTPAANPQHEVKLSNHAAKRLEQRNLEIDSHELLKIKDAIEKLRTKGGRDSLVVTDKAAYIVDVSNSTIVTAVDKTKMSENVFTKIDSTLFVN